MRWISKHYTGYSIEVEGSDNNKYLVSYGLNTFSDDARAKGFDGVLQWGCTCPHQQMRLRLTGGFCKHIYRVMEMTVAEGGICLWMESTNQHPFFILDPLFDQAAWDDMVKAVDDYGITAVYDQPDTIIKRVKDIDESLRPYVPMFGPNGSLIPAIRVADVSYRSSTVVAQYDPNLGQKIKAALASRPVTPVAPTKRTLTTTT